METPLVVVHSSACGTTPLSILRTIAPPHRRHVIALVRRSSSTTLAHLHRDGTACRKASLWELLGLWDLRNRAWTSPDASGVFI